MLFPNLFWKRLLKLQGHEQQQTEKKSLRHRQAILPDNVKEVREDAIVATGRSNFPNQVNNAVPIFSERL